MRSLDRKLLRDLWHLRGQMIAITLVVTCGVAATVTMSGMNASLRASQVSYYDLYRFADVFDHLQRAPEAIIERIRAIPGVATVDSRVVAEVVLDVPGLAEPATGRLVSVPDRPDGMLNALHLRRGRYIEARKADEIVASEAFAEANRLEPGDHIDAIINGRWRRLTIVGIGLSPEYVYQIGGGSLYPDNRHFGVLWMSRSTLGPALDLDGAFNDLSLTLAPGASEAEVIDEVDRLLAPFGGAGAYGRDDQVSHRFLTDEIAQHKVSGVLVGYIFLGVAAFLLNLVLGRLVGTQREQIAVLKAFGYGNVRIGFHYLMLGLVPVLAGVLIGSSLGRYLGGLVTEIFAQFYRFPVLRHLTPPTLLLTTAGVSLLAAAAGALNAVRRAFALPPAEAMRPEAPPGYGAGVLQRLGLGPTLSPPAKMIARGLERRPLKAVLSIFGLALAVSILVIGRYFFDAVPFMMDHGFREVQRQDATVAFTQPRSSRVAHELLRLPGVVRSEPYRVAPVRLRAGHRTYRTVLFGLAPGGELRRLIDRDRRMLPLAGGGVVLTQKLGEILGVLPGDTVTVEVLEGRRTVRPVVVTALLDELLGVSGYLTLDAFQDLLGEGRSLSGSYLSLDPQRTPELYARLKHTPGVAAISLREAALQSFNETVAGSMNISTTVLTIFACVIACGVVYNGLRLALSERSRELASLRVLGFTRGEVTQILVGEQVILTLVAIPAGLAMGFGFAALMPALMNTELYRIPLILTPKSYLIAAGVILIAATGSALLVARRVRRLDLVAVLKARE